MKQVLLSGQGQVAVFDVPAPGFQSGSVLVRNAYSLISSGTEGAAVTKHQGLLGLYERATASRDRVQQVWNMARTQGVPQTLALVRQKLEDYTAIGYSCAGQVMESAEAGAEFHAGDRVACMGTGFASHSEYVVVPKNLVVKIPGQVTYQEAAFGAVAAIALQGIRRLELTPGEHIGVIGLGLIGQLAVRMLAAMGYRAYGSDISDARVSVANACTGVNAWNSLGTDVVQSIKTATNGRMLDGVIICAATASDEVVNLGFELCRQRGRVSVVGDVGLGLQRAKMYAKELELRMSCSYGPGRYDPAYELQGVDYPVGLVRWTEARNLEFFLELLASRRLNLDGLISAKFPVDEATAAYAAVKAGTAGTFGVLLDYQLPANVTPENVAALRVQHRGGFTSSGSAQQNGTAVRIGLIGVGGYAKAVHIPNLKKMGGQVHIAAVASRSGSSAEVVAKKAGASMSTSDYRNILDDSKIDAVVISTRHASHGKIVLDALAAGKHVFVEKPMTIDADEGLVIKKCAEESRLIVRVGFNRRFSPYLKAMKAAIGDQPRRIFLCRVNVGALGNDWSNTTEEGGRLMGEGVHFLDLCNWFAGEDPVNLQASMVGPAETANADATITVSYPGGALGVVVYTTLGSKAAGKEYYEALGGGRLVRMEDFSRYQAHGVSSHAPRNGRGDKGQFAAMNEFIEAVRGNSGASADAANAHAGWLATRMVAAAVDQARLLPNMVASH